MGYEREKSYRNELELFLSEILNVKGNMLYGYLFQSRYLRHTQDGDGF